MIRFSSGREPILIEDLSYECLKGMSAPENRSHFASYPVPPLLFTRLFAETTDDPLHVDCLLKLSAETKGHPVQVKCARDNEEDARTPLPSSLHSRLHKDTHPDMIVVCAIFPPVVDERYIPWIGKWYVTTVRFVSSVKWHGKYKAAEVTPQQLQYRLYEACAMQPAALLQPWPEQETTTLLRRAWGEFVSIRCSIIPEFSDASQPVDVRNEFKKLVQDMGYTGVDVAAAIRAEGFADVPRSSKRVYARESSYLKVSRDDSSTRKRKRKNDVVLITIG